MVVVDERVNREELYWTNHDFFVCTCMHAHICGFGSKGYWVIIELKHKFFNFILNWPPKVTACWMLLQWKYQNGLEFRFIKFTYHNIYIFIFLLQIKSKLPGRKSFQLCILESSLTLQNNQVTYESELSKFAFIWSQVNFKEDSFCMFHVILHFCRNHFARPL